LLGTALDQVVEGKHLPVEALLRLFQTCKATRVRLEELGFDYGVTTLLMELDNCHWQDLSQVLDHVLELSVSEGRESTGWTREVHDFIVGHWYLSRDAGDMAILQSEPTKPTITNDLSSLIKSALFGRESGRLCRGARMLARVGLLDDIGWTDLHKAVVFGPSQGHGSVEDVLMRPGCAIGAKASDDGATAMHLAARKGDAQARRDMVRLRIAGEAVHVTDVQGYTPLSWAAMGGHVECLLELLLWDVNKEMLMAKDKFGKNALMLAIERGNMLQSYVCIDFLVTKGGVPLVNATSKYTIGEYADFGEEHSLPRNDWNALMFAAANGDIEIVKRVVRELIPADSVESFAECFLQRSTNGESYYFIACENGHLEILKLLDDYTPDSVLFETEFHMFSTLMVAAEKGHLDVVKHLTKRGGKNLILLTAMYGETAMSEAKGEEVKDHLRECMRRM